MNLHEIGLAVEGLEQTCWCESPLKADQIACYSHSDGVDVKGFPQPQWVYFHCPRCGYDTALWKILNKARRMWTRGHEMAILQEVMH